MSGLLLHPAVHYEIRGLGPHQTAGGRSCGFEIVLARDFAAACRATPRPPITRLTHRVDAVIAGTFAPERILSGLGLQFVEDSLLLQSVEVPGVNGCLLHLECDRVVGRAGAPERAWGHRDGVAYVTHNVDAPDQAFALLSCWLLWLNGAALIVHPTPSGSGRERR